MTTAPETPETLLSVSDEAEAAAIVTALADYGIEAHATGGYVSGFRAEAPGDITVCVKSAELERARQALAEIRAQQGKIDWSQVDLGEPEDLGDIAQPTDAPPEPMTPLLRQALEELPKLSSAEQDAIASIILKGIADR
jgi:hypothetical protein